MRRRERFENVDHRHVGVFDDQQRAARAGLDGAGEFAADDGDTGARRRPGAGAFFIADERKRARIGFVDGPDALDGRARIAHERRAEALGERLGGEQADALWRRRLAHPPPPAANSLFINWSNSALMSTAGAE
jgi:hypothetical protein